MVAYRLSDVTDLPNKFKFCNAPGNQEEFRLLQDPFRGQFQPLRNKRSTKDTCVINAVADANTFNKRCMRDNMVCSSMMINIVQLTDVLYRNSRFEGNLGTYYTGIGLQVGKLTLYTEHTPGSKNGFYRHFNENYRFDAAKKLQSFARAIALGANTYCLHHLFTDVSDSSGILGRAFTSVLCRVHSVAGLAHNTGISSGTNKLGQFVPSLRYISVVAHEIGHNFGTGHDPDTSECAPNDEHGGKFIMWPIAVPGSHPNNRYFSNCSLRQIGRHIPASCFKDRSKIVGFCGNGIVDDGEQCDAGSFGLNNQDKCCTGGCTFRKFANCSDANDECCTNCTFSDSSKVCRDPGYLYSCLQRSYCTGTSTVCPLGKQVPDGEKCGHQHVCSMGECVGPCKNATIKSTTGKIYLPCSCTKNSMQMCNYCCLDATDPSKPGECQNFAPEPKPDGSPCDGGLCENNQERVERESMAENLLHEIQLDELRRRWAVNNWLSSDSTIAKSQSGTSLKLLPSSSADRNKPTFLESKTPPFTTPASSLQSVL
ncbi:disintegrin and metalloproteinase domain-containing protein 17 [Elysia marginata]|uniref:Disintegrin and metalloproteinase domain-containing protein 17 n=1 Tax=Elysia marginata TaxID=1093978 RepID=A0AAV4J0F9_9GAST|nr:disintegrin and metalloproteinase domain-containing protein 17 [Elysia marginata]